MYILFFVVLGFLAIVGAAHTVLSIIYYCTRVDNDNAYLVIIPKKDKKFDAEFVLRCVALKAQKLGKECVSGIVCISDTLSECELKECELICRDYSYMMIMTSAEFTDMIKA